MIGALGNASRRWLALLPSETAHRAAIAALKLAAPLPASNEPRDPRLKVDAFGLQFQNPLGLAAGFDKDAEAMQGLMKLGFGFIEVGTVTPRPQPGNAKPRLFRLLLDGAIINRMGFNNRGYQAALAQLGSRPAGIIGVNIGPNKDTTDRIEDFVKGVELFAPVADYLTINISSPNTAGLRDLQNRAALDNLVARVVEARDKAAQRRPLLIKIAPDLDLRGLDDVCAIAIARGVDGLIVGNTTVSRPIGLVSSYAKEIGGLSGKPLFELSTRLLARAFVRCEGALKLIGVGGVEDASDALAKIAAGADLVQIYTGFVYRGPELIHDILTGLLGEVKARKLNSIQQMVGESAGKISGAF